MGCDDCASAELLHMPESGSRLGELCEAMRCVCETET